MVRLERRARAAAGIDRHLRLTAIAIAILIVPLALVALALLQAGGEPADGHPLGWALSGALASMAIAFAILAASFLILRHNLYAFAADRMAAADQGRCDGLTGALSRAAFLEEFNQRVTGAASAPVAYLQVDMDHLKTLNDGDGHGAGDAALKHLVGAIRTAAPDALVGRLGGDEFGILLEGCGSKRAAITIGHSILDILNAPTNVAGRQVRLSATLGIALSPEDSAFPDELISLADLALYEGKRTGRHRVLAFDKDMLTDVRHKRLIERELRAAILLDELELHYQPIYRADGRTLAGHEALVRWQHKVRGTIPPGEFIHIAEESDLISRLGEWVLRRACADIDALAAPRLSINVSAAQLRRGDFAERFAAILAETGIEGSRFTVEVTETVPLKATHVDERNLLALREMGVRIAIDDFGAGHASLEYLKKFSFDVLKIDRSYIANLVESPVDRVLVAALCEVGRVAGIEIVAEGVETEEQFQLLKTAGCTLYQGYLLGRPAPLSRKSISPGMAAA